jgi:hypothetical protein
VLDAPRSLDSLALLLLLLLLKMFPETILGLDRGTGAAL